MRDTRKILKIKTFPGLIQYTYSDRQFNRTVSTYHYNKNSSSSDEITRCSISRSISKIKEYCFCNDFDFFFTLTLKSSKRNNVSFSAKTILHSLKNYGKIRKDFKYLIVFEKQIKGGLHIHGFVSGFNDLYINKYGHLESRYFKRIGFHNITPLYKINPFYLIKYISKKPIKELKHRYYCSKNLKTADISYLHFNFDELSNFPFTFHCDFASMITIEL